LSFNRVNKLRVLAELCSNNNLNPNQGNYCGFIRRMAITHLGVTLTAVKELTTALTIAYRTDQWKSLLQTPTETEQATSNTTTTNATDKRQQVHTSMQKLSLNTHPEPVKKLEPKQSTQQDNLTENQTAQILYGMAQRDQFNGVGRIILYDARQVVDNKHLQIHELQSLWQRNYPAIEAETKSNTLQIYWDGKDAITYNRPVYIQPKAPTFTPQNQESGDITEDDEGVVPEQEGGQLG
jgi:hypothetical protein